MVGMNQRLNNKLLRNVIPKKTKLTMIVTTASSMSGALAKFKFLGNLYKKFNPMGLEIIAMPSNQFNCERNNLEKIVALIKNAAFKDHGNGNMFKLMNFGKVNGPDAHHLYKFLR